MKYYILPPIAIFVIFFIVARLMSSWAALGYMIMAIGGILGLILSGIFYLIERKKKWVLAIWLQLLIGVAFCVAGFFTLILLARFGN
jgi:phosphoglycerol transferase MdoB-like AlkP superfamily enzyme